MRAAWCNASWIGPGMGQIDPLKEGKSSVMKVQNNLSTYEEEHLQDKGGRWDMAMHRRAEEDKLLKELGLYVLKEADLEEVSGPTGTAVTKSNDQQVVKEKTKEITNNPSEETKNG